MQGAAQNIQHFLLCNIMSYFKPEPKKSLFFNLKKIHLLAAAAFLLQHRQHIAQSLLLLLKIFTWKVILNLFFFSSSSVSTVFSSRSVTERRQFDDRGLVSTSRTRARFLLSLFRCSSVGCRGGTGAPRGMPSVHSTLTPVSLTVGLDLEISVCFWHFQAVIIQSDKCKTYLVLYIFFSQCIQKYICLIIRKCKAF